VAPICLSGLDALIALGCEPGWWFRFDDDFWGPDTSVTPPRPKRRRFLLLSSWMPQHPTAQLAPRTTEEPWEAGEGTAHPRHPRGHDSRCCVDRDGWIIHERLTVDSERIRDCRYCPEPDQSVLPGVLTCIVS
jgi:hypothetical protein